MQEYKKLDKTLNEDVDLLRELSSALNERREIMQRLDYLNDLIDDNDDYLSAIWTTQFGVSKPIADLDNEHLKNVALHLASRGKTNKRIIDEYIKRFGKAELPKQLLERVISGAIRIVNDDDDYDNDGHDYKPF